MEEVKEGFFFLVENTNVCWWTGMNNKQRVKFDVVQQTNGITEEEKNIGIKSQNCP